MVDPTVQKAPTPPPAKPVQILAAKKSKSSAEDMVHNIVQAKLKAAKMMAQTGIDTS